jgi:rubredoxin
MENELYKCTECGAVFSANSIEQTTVYEDWGDVVVWVCPACHRVDFEGRDMIVPVTKEDKE